MKFVDFHTHHPLHNEESTSLYCHTNLDAPLPKIVTEQGLNFSAGLHPWFLPHSTEEVEKLWPLLLQFLEQENCIGLGECGLDRLKGPDFSLQLFALERQLALAKERAEKLMIFHCVRAYPECLGQIKKSSYEGSVVFHDFGANRDTLDQILQFPQCFFSLGAALERSHFIENVLPHVPLERVVLETDDNNQVTIKERYRQLSEALNLSLEEVKTTLYKNAQTLLQKPL